MAISIVLKSGSGDVVCMAPVAYVADPSADITEQGLLAGIDPVGKTAFNARQMSVLITEATDQLGAAQGERRDALLALVDLCRVGQRPPHRMLWFLGD